MVDSHAFGARVIGQWSARDATSHSRNAEPNPTKPYWLDPVQNGDGDNEDSLRPCSIDLVRDVTESIFAATEANPDMVQLLAPFTRAEPGPLL